MADLIRIPPVPEGETPWDMLSSPKGFSDAVRPRQGRRRALVKKQRSVGGSSSPLGRSH
jgi:hypothetical protein